MCIFTNNIHSKPPIWKVFSRDGGLHSTAAGMVALLLYYGMLLTKKNENKMS